MLQFTQLVPAAPELVQKALTSAPLLRQWLCDGGTVEGNGNFLFNWNNGYCVTGRFTEQSPERVAFTWRGSSDHAASNVVITLTGANGGTTIQIAHSDIHPDDAASIERGWIDALERILIVFETGEDIRLTRRPMIGISPTPLNAELAQKAGVPVTRGTYLDGVMEGKGAHAAGLRKGDVIVTLDGKEVYSFETMAAAVQPHKAGDIIAVEFYRGADKHSVALTLSGRERLHAQPTVAELAAYMRDRYVELDAELDRLMADVPEDALECAPQPGEWCANEVLAHLIFTERFWQTYIFAMVDGDDNVPWHSNNRTQIAGILAVRSTGAELVAELKRAEQETLHTVKAIPASFEALRPLFTRLSDYLAGLHEHTWEHFAQMRAAIQAWRETATAAG